MTFAELENENEFLRERNKELSEQITELKSELLLLKSEQEAELEPRYYFNRIIDDYQGDDDVDRLVEIVDYLNGYINNHGDETTSAGGNNIMTIFGE